MRATIVAVLLAAASQAHADPEQRAREVLAAQLAQVNDPTALAGLLAPDALVFGNGSIALARGEHAAAVLATLGASPSGLPVLQPSIDQLAAGGDDHALWLDATVTLVQRAPRGRSGPLATRAHVVELIAAGRVVALGFATTGRVTAPGDVLARPASGVLLAFALAPWRGRDVRVIGALEVRGASWGYVAAELTVDGRATPVLVLAVPLQRSEWQVVAQLGQE